MKRYNLTLSGGDRPTWNLTSAERGDVIISTYPTKDNALSQAKQYLESHGGGLVIINENGNENTINVSEFVFTIPTPSGLLPIEPQQGQSIYFLGANGGGKTRLAAKIELSLGIKAHRISAHRALILNANVEKISEEQAINKHFAGSTAPLNVAYRVGNRWGNQPSTALLNDFDSLLQLLFAEQTNTALRTHKRARSGLVQEPDPTKFERLQKIWEDLLPHRKLEIGGDSIKVISGEGRPLYDAREMSDGERAIFYLLGQTLCALPNSAVIFDEPELHIHRSIMSRLWDELEALRQDCAFIVISHDIDFLANRVGRKYVIRDYMPEIWTLEEVPSDTGFSEEITSQILGSRRPILFVEGKGTSLDLAIYRACYPRFTVIPRNSCGEVIHAVVTMRANQALTRVTCTGIVDSDGYTAEHIAYLNGLGIRVLEVSEIENLLLLPAISRAIGAHEGYDDGALDAKQNEITDAVIANIRHATNLEDAVLLHCRRQIDSILKKIDFSNSRTVADLDTEYRRETASLDVNAIALGRRESIEDCIARRDLTGLLKLYDNKGLVNIVAQKMKATKLAEFENWVIRILNNKSIQTITAAFITNVPEITAA